MEINYNIISLFDLMALVQGVVFGLILIFRNQSKRPSLYLGLFLLTYSINLTNAILSDSDLLHQSISFIFLPINFFFLTIPLLYIYTKKLIRPISVKAQFLILSAGILEFLSFLWLYLLPKDQKWGLVRHKMINTYNIAYQLASIAFSIVFLLLIIRLIRINKDKIMDYYSNAEEMQLKWVQTVAIIILIYFLLSGLTLVRSVPVLEDNLYLFLSIGNLIFIYWIGISGIRQRRVEIIEKIEEIPTETPQVLVISNTQQDSENYNIIYQSIIKNQLYRHAELNLPELAIHLGYSRGELSRLINLYSGTNFNNFMNQFRVSQAMQMLSNKANDQLNMVGIADEVGFKSKTTFFTAFKKFTGMTPGQYKKNTQIG